MTPTTLYAATLRIFSIQGTRTDMFKSTDSGGTWSTINPAAAPQIYALAVDPLTPTTLYAGNSSGVVYKSTDGGGNWVAIPLPLPTVSPVLALALDPVTPTTLYAATGLGLFKSTDGGANWVAINDGLTNFNPQTLAVATPTTTLYVVGIGGVFKSIDGGGHWVASGLTNTYVTALAVDPVTPTTVYAGTNAFNTLFNAAGVFMSTDGGENWVAINAGLANPSIRALVVDPVSPQRPVYVATEGSGVFVLRQNVWPFSKAPR